MTERSETIRFTRAIVRTPAESISIGLTTQSMGSPDYPLALRQHEQYVQALETCGLTVKVLPPQPGYPDSCFVEDTAVLVAEAAVITNPGADSRRDEVVTIAPAVAETFDTVRHVEHPATLDGGDVMQIGHILYAGISDRTNTAGAQALRHALEPYGYRTVDVPLAGGLHLKSDVNWLGGDTLLLTRAFANRPEFAQFSRLVVPEGEEYAANCLRINDHLLVPRGFAGVRAMVAELGLEIIELDMSEFQKIDGGLSCLSLRF